MDINRDAQASRTPSWGDERVKASRFSKPNSGLDYSTVMECDPLTVLAKDTNLYFLTLGLEINVADLWVSHYSDHQQYLFETITKFRAEGWSYIKISEWFNDNDISTPRGKKFIPASVHSIVKKKRISDERFGRTFPLVINEADINVQNTTPTDFK